MQIAIYRDRLGMDGCFCYIGCVHVTHKQKLQLAKSTHTVIKFSFFESVDQSKMCIYTRVVDKYL